MEFNPKLIGGAMPKDEFFSMLKIDKIRKAQNPAFYVIDYLWGGFASLGGGVLFHSRLAGGERGLRAANLARTRGCFFLRRAKF